MDAGDKDKIDELLELTRENNRILRKMNRKLMWSQIFTFIYWLIILGVAGWSYYYFQPYIEQYFSLYQKLMSTLGGNPGAQLLPANLQNMLNSVEHLPK